MRVRGFCTDRKVDRVFQNIMEVCLWSGIDRSVKVNLVVLSIVTMEPQGDKHYNSERHRENSKNEMNKLCYQSRHF